MIFKSSSKRHRLIDYGILIPLEQDRITQIIDCIGASNVNQISLAKLTRQELLLAHNQDFVDELIGESCVKWMLKCYECINADGTYHRYDPKIAKYPLADLRDELLTEARGVAQGINLALELGLSFFLGGGMHHAKSSGAAGFCPVNDIVIGIRIAQKSLAIKNAWVVDVDAHKGDGTAEMTQNDSSIVTCSIHMANAWPLDDESKRDYPSNLDIAMRAGEEALYLEKLASSLAFLQQEYPLPDVVVVVLGADPFELDELPSTRGLMLSEQQMLARDQMIYEFFAVRNIAMTFVMAGGYGRQVYKVYANFLNWLLHKKGLSCGNMRLAGRK